MFTFSFRNNSELFLTLLVISMPVKLACRNTFHDMIASIQLKPTQVNQLCTGLTINIMALSGTKKN